MYDSVKMVLIRVTLGIKVLPYRYQISTEPDNFNTNFNTEKSMATGFLRVYSSNGI